MGFKKDMIEENPSPKKYEEDPAAEPVFLSFKYTGDLENEYELPYKPADYVDGPVSNRSLKLPSASSSTLGFDLTSMSSKRGHFVDHVVPGSAAEAAGLKKGDHLSEINGRHIRDLEHAEVIALIRAATADGAEGELNLKVVGSKVGDEDRRVDVKGPAPLARHEDDEDREDGIHSVTLVKSTLSENLGFILTYSPERAHVVDKVVPESVAFRAGLFKGDHLVEADGNKVKDWVHSKVVNLVRELSKNSLELRFKIERKRIVERRMEEEEITAVRELDAAVKEEDVGDNADAESVASHDSASDTEGHVALASQATNSMPAVDCRLCLLVKSHSREGLGFNLSSAKKVHAISDVAKDSVAERAGLKKGDIVLQVNDVNVKQLSHQDLAALIRQLAGNNVNVALRVSPGDNEEIRRNEPLSDEIDGPKEANTELKKTTTVFKVVTLAKPAPKSGMGFDMTSSTDNVHKIKQVIPDSVASKAGLESGDVIIEANGKEIIGLNHNLAVSLIRQMSMDNDKVDMKVERRVSIPYITFSSNEEPSASENDTEVDSGPRAPEEPAEDTNQTREATKTCILMKPTLNVGLGFDLTTDQGQHRIDVVSPDSVASRAGLQTGDIVVGINQTNVKELPHRDMVYLIRQLSMDREPIRMEVVAKNGDIVRGSSSGVIMDPKSLASALPQPGRILTLDLQPGCSLGLDIVRVSGAHKVDRVKPGGLAERAGLHDGDVIVAVNERPVNDMAHRKLVEFIHQCVKKGGEMRVAVEEVEVETNMAEQERRPEAPATTKTTPELRVLKKSSPSSGLGFVLTSGDHGTHRVDHVVSDSPADQAGLAVGDSVTGINGRDVVEMKHKDVVALIRQVSRDSDKLELRVDAMAETKESPIRPRRRSKVVRPRTVTLSRSPGHSSAPLGFKLASSSETGHVIQTVEAGSDAQKAGLKENDHVLTVNGRKVQDMAHEEMVALLKGLVDQFVDLEFQVVSEE